MQRGIYIGRLWEPQLNQEGDRYQLPRVSGSLLRPGVETLMRRHNFTLILVGNEIRNPEQNFVSWEDWRETKKEIARGRGTGER